MIDDAHDDMINLLISLGMLQPGLHNICTFYLDSELELISHGSAEMNPGSPILLCTISAKLRWVIYVTFQQQTSKPCSFYVAK